MQRKNFLGLAALLAAYVFGATPLAAQEPISFTKEIKPILDAKCVSCHACYESPAQLDLRNAKGIQRGAMKIEGYLARLKEVPPTRIWDSPNTIEDWRKRGFFSVTEGGKDSIMAKMLQLGHNNPAQANARFPEDIQIDSLTRKPVMPNLSEMEAYAKEHPKEGMPLAVAGLTAKEYSTMINWLGQGAPFDEVAPKPTTLEQTKIDQWETYLNATDNRSKLIARYIFEHMYQYHIYFDKSGKGNFFILVRSSTPSGQDPVPVAAQLANSPVEGPFYYRLKIVDQTLCFKQHQQLLDGNKLDRYKKIFAETDWNVDKLPGYSKEERWDPLNTFATIPAKARWKFLLADVRLHRGSLVWSPSCYGSMAVGVIQDEEWDFFEDPETSLYVNDAEYRADLAPYVKLMMEPDDPTQILSALKDGVDSRVAVVTKTTARLAEGRDNRSRITDIWRGDEPGDTPIVVLYRNKDNAFVAEPNVAIGHFPKTAGVFNLPILEKMIYESVIDYDQFGAAQNWFVSRAGFGLSRRDWEMNFLRFLPADQRRDIYASWYQRSHPELTPERGGVPDFDELNSFVLEMTYPDLGPEVMLPAEIQFKTDDPKSELLSTLLDYLKDRIQTADPINRPQAGDNPDRVTKAMQSIVAASTQRQPTWRKFKTMLPEATFLRIDAPGKDSEIYTMTLDRYFRTKNFVSSELQDEVPSLAHVTIYPGILTAYPNFIFRIDEKDIEEFATKLIDADTQAKFTAVVERWGVRRSNPEFWQVVHSITEYVRRKNPLEAAVFDVNRYKNL